jgi:hypothetical protein
MRDDRERGLDKVESEGITEVLVNAVVVVRDSKLVESARPGQAIRRPRAGQ